MLLALGLLGACGSGNDQPAASTNRAAEIDALVRNLSAKADAWRDDTDNQEAAAAAQLLADDVANIRTSATDVVITENRP